MSKNTKNADAKTVRLVIKLNPEVAKKIREIPARKRSAFIESAVLEMIANEEREYAFQNFFRVRENLKGKADIAKILEQLRKDRENH